MTPIPVSLAAEGDLDEFVLRKLIEQSGRPFAVGNCYGKRGKDHLRENVPRFNRAAAHVPFIVLADLDDEVCAAALIGDWLPRGLKADKNSPSFPARELPDSCRLTYRNIRRESFDCFHRSIQAWR